MASRLFQRKAAGKNGAPQDKFTVDLKDVLGTGSFGVVYRARDRRGGAIAAKEIKQNPAGLSQRLPDLLRLDHINLVKVFYTTQQNHAIWMFMEFCEGGDLDSFFACRGTVSPGQMLDVMTQMTRGVAYLHSRDVVHRDVKPANTLVHHADPLHVKLSDFDLCKFLGDADTSRLSTDVGTTAFKAPEFFLRNADMQISYHRNVDTYALALTFLAMLQWPREGSKKNLRPQIETLHVESEKHEAVGRLIAERIRYKVSDLRILDPDITEAERDPIRRQVRQLIPVMTALDAGKRPSARSVLQWLGDVRAAPSTEPAGAHDAQDADHYVAELVTATRGRLAVCADRAFTDTPSLPRGIRVWDISNTARPELCSTVPARCQHLTFCLSALPGDHDHVLETCATCRQIRRYNVSTGVSESAETTYQPRLISPGPGESVLVLDNACSVLQLLWTRHMAQPQYLRGVNTPRRDLQQQRPTQLCYAEKHDAVIVSNETPGRTVELEALELQSGRVLWRLDPGVRCREGVVSALLCAVLGEHVYLYDQEARRVLGVDGASGRVGAERPLTVPGFRRLDGVAWHPTQQRLIASAMGVTVLSAPWENPGLFS